MLTLIRWGGVPMWFILLFGLLCLGAAALQAARPGPGRLAFARHMGLATLFSVLTGTCADLAMVFVKVPQMTTEQAIPWQVYSQGLGESMSPGIIGFTLLSLAALLVAVGGARARGGALAGLDRPS